ncbi:hypothetical protein [Pectinatus brassicae]|uniref:Flagellar basal body-associated protein FliL n=1 Tax=Pectinatus brassicae TaxID=862415 RepID=A0A840UGF2_9FIRM|nr:hypothetical protein [Pectinatus brassicae]MBB5336089.1 flagellar basal body-associated protein FliL [Pectinatus brassicae]
MEQKKRILFIAIGLIIVLGIISAAGYFLYYKKTPAYSLNLIRKSVQNHDWDTFQKHVDIDQTLSAAIDDVTATQNQKNASLLGNGLVKMLKPVIISEVKSKLKSYIENTSSQKDDSDKAKSNDLSSNRMTKKLTATTGLEVTEFKGIAYTKKENGTATVGLSLYNKDLDKTFVLDLKMHQLDDGTWQIIKIDNLNKYIEEIKTAEKEKLVQLNKSLQDQLNKTVDFGKITPSITDGTGLMFGKILHLEFPVTVTSDKELLGFQAQLTITDKNGTILSERKISGRIPAGQTSFNKKISIPLNNDSPLLKADLNTVKVTLNTSAIADKNKKVTKLRTSLFDKN